MTNPATHYSKSVRRHTDHSSRMPEISQQLKHIFAEHIIVNFKPEQIEALDMIALKLSRILSGQANFRDHWDDIAGYAKLASEACDK